MEYRHKTSLWGYKKLANNEIVKDDEDISKTSSSCFKLKKTLKVRFQISFILFYAQFN